MSITEIDIDALDMVELKKLKRDVEMAIDDFAKRKMRLALEEIEAVCKKHGLSLADISNASKFAKPRKARKTTGRYRNPNDPSKIWTGMGRAPAWFKQAIDDGLKKEDMLIAE